MPNAWELGVESVNDVVEHTFGIAGTARGNELDILCPNPQHPENRPSCGVNLESGLWHCFSCGAGGDLADLGAVALGITRDDALVLLKPSTPQAVVNSIARRIEKLMHKTKSKDKRIHLPGPYEPGPLDYLYNRGFTKEVTKRWGCRYVPTEHFTNKEGRDYTITGFIAIPIRDHTGRLMSWCYRKTDVSPNWCPRYLYTPGTSLSEVWGGIHLHHSAREVVVTEGLLDAMWVDQCGHPALALLGSTMGGRKLRWLQRYERVILFCDRDAAGVRAAWNIGGEIGNRVPLFVARYAQWMEGKDPQDLAPVDVELAVAKAVPWPVWQQQAQPEGEAHGKRNGKPLGRSTNGVLRQDKDRRSQSLQAHPRLGRRGR